MNREIERDIRRCRDYLAGIGTGIILFGLWSVVKLFMQLFLDWDNIVSSMGETDPRMAILVTALAGIVASAFILGWNLYIGLCARSEAIKGKKRWFYLVISGFMVLAYGNGLVSETIHFQKVFDSMGTGLITVMIDFTVVITLIELMYASIKNKILCRKLAKQEV